MSQSLRPALRKLAALAASATLLFGAAACGDDGETSADDGATGQTAAADTRQFELPDGTTVEIPTEPQSIVACGYAVLPLIQAGANLSAVCEWTRELENMNDEEKAAYEDIAKVAPDGDVSALDYDRAGDGGGGSAQEGDRPDAEQPGSGDAGSE